MQTENPELLVPGDPSNQNPAWTAWLLLDDNKDSIENQRLPAGMVYHFWLVAQRRLLAHEVRADCAVVYTEFREVEVNRRLQAWLIGLCFQRGLEMADS